MIPIVLPSTLIFTSRCAFWNLEDPIGFKRFVAYRTGHEELCMHRADAVWAAVQRWTHIVPTDQ